MALKDKVIDKIAAAYQGPLKTPRLVELTFGDLRIVGKQIEKMRKLAKRKNELKAWDRMSCAACFGKYH